MPAPQATSSDNDFAREFETWRAQQAPPAPPETSAPSSASTFEQEFEAWRARPATSSQQETAVSSPASTFEQEFEAWRATPAAPARDPRAPQPIRPPLHDAPAPPRPDGIWDRLETAARASRLGESQTGDLVGPPAPDAAASRVGRNAPRAIATTPWHLAQGLYGGLGAASEVGSALVTRPIAQATGLPDPLAAAGAWWRDWQRTAQRGAADVRGPQTGAGTMEKAAYSGIESLGQTGALAVTALATGQPWLLLGGMGLTEGGRAYGEARDAGREVLPSLGYAVAQGGVEVLTEKIPAKYLLGDITQHAGFLRTVGRQAISEIPGEQIATAWQDLNEWAVLHPDRPFAAYLRERPSAAAQTLVATIVAVGGQGVLARVAQAATAAPGGSTFPGAPPPQAAPDASDGDLDAQARAARERIRQRGTLPVAPISPAQTTMEDARVPGDRRTALTAPVAEDRRTGERRQPTGIAPYLKLDAAVQGQVAAERRADEAQRAADVDPLTGVANRRALDRALPAAEADLATVVVAFDANHFGQVNKIAGHDAGDTVLREMAQAIETAAQESSVSARVFRRGGDEFVILAPAAQAEAIRTRAEAAFGTRQVGEYPVSLTGTVGPTFAEADAQLQAAKAQRKAQGSNLPATVVTPEVIDGADIVLMNPSPLTIRQKEAEGYVRGETLADGSVVMRYGKHTRAALVPTARSQDDRPISPEVQAARLETAGPEADWTLQQPTSFRGWQDTGTAGDPPIALYNAYPAWAAGRAATYDAATLERYGLEVPETPAPPAPPVAPPRIGHAPALKAVEVVFEAKPETAVQDRLRTDGFRSTYGGTRWYQPLRSTPLAAGLQATRALLDDLSPQVAGVDTIPAGAQTTDDAPTGAAADRRGSPVLDPGAPGRGPDGSAPPVDPVGAGPGSPQPDSQRDPADAAGRVEESGDGGGAERRRLPASHEYPVVAFTRATPDADRARLTPAVTRELERMLLELREFPFEPRTWHWLSDAEAKTGNAAGGAADIIAGSAGAPVYNDILAFGPLNAGKHRDGLASKVRGSRGQVEAAIRSILGAQVIPNNLAEGAVRVAEHRAAGDYTEIGRPLFPLETAQELSQTATDALSALVDEAIEAGALESDSVELPDAVADASFDVSEFEASRPPDVSNVEATSTSPAPPTIDTLPTGEQQPRLPGAEGVREQDQPTPQMEAPFALTGEVAADDVGQQGGLLDRLDAMEQEAKARIQDRGTFSGTKLSSGLPLEDLGDLALIGAVKITRGAVQFTQWSAAMAREFGEGIRPHLRAVFDRARAVAAEYQRWDRDALADLRTRILATPDRAVAIRPWMRGSREQILANVMAAHGPTDRVATNTDTTHRIIIARQGLKTALSHGNFPQKVAVLGALPDLLRDAVFVVRDTESLKKGVQGVETYAVRVTVDGDPFVARLIVRETDGRRFYDHELSSLTPEGEAQGSPVPQGAGRTHSPSRTVPSHSLTSLGKSILDAALAVNRVAPLGLGLDVSVDPIELDSETIRERLAQIDAAVAQGRRPTADEQRYRAQLEEELKPWRMERDAIATEARFRALSTKRRRTRAEAIELALLPRPPKPATATSGRRVGVMHDPLVDLPRDLTRDELITLYEAHGADRPFDKALRLQIRKVAFELGFDPIDPLASQASDTTPLPALAARLDTVAERALARIRARGTFSGGRALTGLPADDLWDLTLVGAAKIAQGLIQFSSWSTVMLQEFGDQIQPHLRDLYDRATAKAAEFGAVRTQADRDEAVRQYFRRLPGPPYSEADLEGFVTHYRALPEHFEALRGEPSRSATLATRLDAVADLALKRIRQRGTLSGGRVMSGLPVDDLADLVLYGAAKIGKGLIQFPAWSAEMVAEFGEGIRPHLLEVFGKARIRAAEFSARPTIRHLPELKAVEVAFTAAPSEATQARLRARGFRPTYQGTRWVRQLRGTAVADGLAAAQAEFASLDPQLETPVGEDVRSLPDGGDDLAGPPRTPTTPTDAMRPAQIVASLQRALGGVPIKVGRLQQRARGIYKPGARVIRTRVAQDLRAVLHEAGHDFDEAVLQLRRADPRWRGELLALGAPTSKPSYTADQRLAEGAAEFFVRYLTNEGAAESRAPHYFAAVEAALAEQPALRTALLGTRDALQGYLGLSPADQGRLAINRDRPGAVRQGVRRLLDDPQATAATVIHDVMTKTVDDLQWLHAAVDQMRAGRPLAASENAYILARTARGSAGKAEAFLEYGIRGRDGRFLGGSLRQALEPVSGKVPLWEDYMVALRIRELIRDRGRKHPGMTLRQAEAIIAETEDRPDAADFQTARDRYWAFKDALLQYAQESGALSATQVATIRALNQAYIPLKRVLDVTEVAFGGGARRVANRTSPLRRIGDSNREIIAPTESIVGDVFALVDMVEKNRAMQALVAQAEGASGSGQWIERIPTPQVATRFRLEAVAREVRDALAEGAGPDVAVDPDAMVTLFAPATFLTPTLQQEGIVTVIRDGRREFWQVHHRGLYDAITLMGPRDTAGILRQVAASSANLLRTTATVTGAFIIRNSVRDQGTAFLQSRHGFIPVYDTARAIVSMVRGDADAQRFYTAGIAQATFLGNDRQHRAAQAQRLTARRGTPLHELVVTTHPLEAVRAMYEFLRAASSRVEEVTRLAEFKLALESGGQDRTLLQRLTQPRRSHPVTEETLTAATLAARDVTTDFQRGGSAVKELSRYYAFLNARLQGYVRMNETFVRAARDPRGAGLDLMLKLGAMSLFSAALWFALEDDEEYQAKPAWERHAYWHLPIHAHVPGVGYVDFIRIPKPFEWAYFGGDVTEAALDYARQGDATRFREMREEFFPGWSDPDAVTRTILNLMPTIVIPPLEAAVNYSAFRDAPIVSPWDLDLPKDLQYTRWTSETAKQLQKVMPMLSPAQIDHVISGYTTNYGRSALWASDVALEATGRAEAQHRPAPPVGRVPVVGAFLDDGTITSGRFTDLIYRVAAEFEALEQAMTRERRAGRLDRAQARREAIGDHPWAGRRDLILRARAQFTNAGHRIKAIYDAPPERVSPAQKAEQIQQIRLQMERMARQALGQRPLESTDRRPREATR